MRHALEWIVSCCVELYLNNEQFMFYNEITVSGITAFLEHFNYSKYCIKQQFYDLLKSDKQKDFLVFYKERKMIIRTAFAKYLEAHPDLRRRC